MVNMFERKAPLEMYAYYMQQANLDVPPLLWLAGSFLAGIAAGLFTFFGLALLKINEPLIGALAFAIVTDVLVGFPYIKGKARIDSIEENLPDALKQISDTLKTGSTYEYALREVAASQYGPLTEEMKKVLRKLEEGENFENSLFTLSRGVESRLVRRVVTIIVDTVRAGAALADILDDISQDVREMNRIAQERKTKTVLQVIFMLAAGVIVAPFIFGLVSTILDFLIGASSQTGGLEGAKLQQVKNARDLIIFGVKGYVFVIAVSAAAMIGIMRDGKLSKSLIYLPLLLMVAYAVFYLSQFAVGMLVGM
ncbi:MAG: type II secretion system F family protein [Candidatus Diapherotrites archaeon]